MVKVISVAALAILQLLIIAFMVVMGIIGFIMLAPFPGFWKEILSEDGSGYGKGEILPGVARTKTARKESDN
ncbi:hypothetical protein GAV44_23270 [Salmonella enterica subsp. enterica serovar Newport]|nr:hypothetical protein [Salmonella enterica subsp. enterica serovar Newport]